MTVTVQEAQAQLPKLIEQAMSGEEVIIADDGGTPVRLAPVEQKPAHKKLGMLEGMYDVPDDIKTPFEKEIEEMFYGDSDSA